MNREHKSETTPAAPPNRATNSAPNGASNDRSDPITLRAKLRFFRTMLWVLIYAIGVLFFFALILLGGFRFQTKVIGGALLACVLLVVATYILQWRD